MVLSVLLVPMQQVIMKMLPFDNKSELQLVVDMKKGTTLESTNQVQIELAVYLSSVEAVKHSVAYAGTSSPNNFNGLIRQYYFRTGAHIADIQITLNFSG